MDAAGRIECHAMTWINALEDQTLWYSREKSDISSFPIILHLTTTQVTTSITDLFQQFCEFYKE